jgi:hypothetical protein
VLNIKPLGSFTSDDVWSNSASVQPFLDEIYNESVFGLKDAGFGWGAETDELYSNFNWCGENTFVQGLVTPDSWTASGSYNYDGTLSFWPGLYSTIQKINIFFQNIGKVDTVGSSDQINYMKGQVHFLRALCYFELLKRYGGVPIITKTYSINDTTFNVPRASWDSTKNYILDEINASIPLLPTTVSSDEYGKITLGAALALKSRLLLYAASPYFNLNNDKSKWQAAADAAKAVINLNLYSLYGNASTYGRIFTDFGNPEVIFARVYDGSINNDRYNTAYRDMSPNGYNGYSCYDPLQQMVDAFEMSDGSSFSWNNPLEAANPYSNRDPRFYADVLFNGAEFQGRAAQFYKGGLDSKTSPLAPWNASKTGYTIRKMVDESYNFQSIPQCSVQWVIFRLSEIYLNYAEAEAELGNVNEALTYLNKIRERVSMPDVVYTNASDLIEKIRQERRIELCFEGFRYFDLRRWGEAQIGGQDALGISITPTSPADTSFTYQIVTIQKRYWNNNMYYYPIPRSEIQRDPSLVQNPGYN